MRWERPSRAIYEIWTRCGVQLSAILQRARYAKLVQGIDVSGVEEQARTVIAAVDHLREA